MDSLPGFTPPPERRPRARREPPSGHYALIVSACGLSYGTMPVATRQRVGRLATRLRSNGVAERRVIEEAARARARLGRAPTLEELAWHLLG